MEYNRLNVGIRTAETIYISRVYYFVFNSKHKTKWLISYGFS